MKLDDLVNSISKLAEVHQNLGKQAFVAYKIEVENLIRSKTTDQNQIEHLLDGMVSFCFDKDMLQLYKQLCRYFYAINPAATIYHIHAYRDMWDEKHLAKVDKRNTLLRYIKRRER
jgi:hypothetical protein